MDEFVNVAGALGVPTAILAAAGWSLWRSLQWIGREVLKPLADRHIRFLDALETCLRAQTETLASLREMMHRGLEAQQRHIDICSRKQS